MWVHCCFIYNRIISQASLFVYFASFIGFYDVVKIASFNSRDTVSNLFQQVLGQIIPFVYAREIGRKPTGDIDNRTILLKVCSYTHKEMPLRDHPSLFSDYTDKGVSKTEGRHNYYCKITLNVTKYSSTKSVYTELGRGPIMNQAWGMAIKYWILLANRNCQHFFEWSSYWG